MEKEIQKRLQMITADFSKQINELFAEHLSDGMSIQIDKVHTSLKHEENQMVTIKETFSKTKGISLIGEEKLLKGLFNCTNPIFHPNGTITCGHP